MDKITLKRPVVLKAVVTDRLKEQTKEQLQKSIKQIDVELEQIDFQAKRLLPELEKQNLKQAMAVKNQIESEKQKREELRSRLNQTISEVSDWNIGDVVTQGTLESEVEVSLGDNLEEVLSAEILIKDGKIIEMNQGAEIDSDAIQETLSLSESSVDKGRTTGNILLP